MTKLLPSPYKTNCFDYTKIGCKSRTDCVDKCNIERGLKQCKSLPLYTKGDKHNNRDEYKESDCMWYFNYSICEDKYKSPDCINEYFSLKTTLDSSFKALGDNNYDAFLSNMGEHMNQSGIKIGSVIEIRIIFSEEPDTIYIHLPEVYCIEFVCFIGGVISLWTGFSIFSLYAHGKRLFIGQINQRTKSLFTKTKVITIVKKIYPKKERFHNKKSADKRIKRWNGVVVPIETESA